MTKVSLSPFISLRERAVSREIDCRGDQKHIQTGIRLETHSVDYQFPYELLTSNDLAL
jgi:hypothetical protein